eukprot:3442910-Rhodomonas_salina.1
MRFHALCHPHASERQRRACQNMFLIRMIRSTHATPAAQEQILPHATRQHRDGIIRRQYRAQQSTRSVPGFAQYVVSTVHDASTGNDTGTGHGGGSRPAGVVDADALPEELVRADHKREPATARPEVTAHPPRGHVTPSWSRHAARMVTSR